MKKIVARFFLSVILEDHPKNLWERCKDFSDIDEIEYFKYFDKIEKGLAIKITELKFFKKPIDPKLVFPDFVAPPSFCYIDDIEGRESITSIYYRWNCSSLELEKDLFVYIEIGFNPITILYFCGLPNSFSFPS